MTDNHDTPVRRFNEFTLRDDIHATWGAAGAHADVYDELMKLAVRGQVLQDINVALLEVLDDVDLCIRAGDMERLTFVAFVWSQAQERILAGSQTWADQKIPPHILGGGTPISERRQAMQRP